MITETQPRRSGKAAGHAPTCAPGGLAPPLPYDGRGERRFWVAIPGPASPGDAAAPRAHPTAKRSNATRMAANLANREARCPAFRPAARVRAVAAGPGFPPTTP